MRRGANDENLYRSACGGVLFVDAGWERKGSKAVHDGVHCHADCVVCAGTCAVVSVTAKSLHKE